MMRSLPLMICAAALVIGHGAALARPTKIAMTKVEGDVSGVGKAVSDALEDSELVIVPSRQVDRAIVRLGLDDNFGDRGAQKLGEDLEVDAVVRTAYDRRRSRMRFTIFAHGRRVKPFSVEVSDVQSDKFRRVVRAAVISRIVAARKEAEASGEVPSAASDKPKLEAEAKPAPAAGPVTSISAAEDGKKTKGKAAAKKEVAKPAAPATKEPAAKPAAEEPAVEASAKPAPQVTEEPAEPKGAKPVDPPFAAAPKTNEQAKTTEPASEPAPAATRPNTRLAAAKPQLASARDDDSDVVSSNNRLRAEASGPAKPRSFNLAAVRADLGVSMTARSLSFEAPGGTAPKSFSSAAFPGAHVEAEVYPLAMGDNRGLLSGIGIAGSFDQAVPLTVHTAAAPTAEINASESSYSIGLRYRIAFGRTPTSPTLTLGAGVGSRQFSVTPVAGQAVDLPNVSYMLFDPGLAFRLPLGERFAVTAAGRGLIIAAAGQIQQQDQYGTTTVMGMNGSAGLEVMLLRDRLALRVGGEATQINFSFAGTGAKTNSGAVKKASDTYLGGVASLAVVY